MTGFYMKCNTGLEWVIAFQNYVSKAYIITEIIFGKEYFCANISNPTHRLGKISGFSYFAWNVIVWRIFFKWQLRDSKPRPQTNTQPFRQTSQTGFTLKLVRDMIITHSQNYFHFANLWFYSDKELRMFQKCNVPKNNISGKRATC